MRNTHTPGPWTVAPSSNPKNGSGWRDIHSLGGEFSPAYIGEAMAYDAQLIAAAPELLAALIELEKLFAPLVYGPNGECPGLTRGEVAIIAARSAIAKAGV